MSSSLDPTSLQQLTARMAAFLFAVGRNGLAKLPRYPVRAGIEHGQATVYVAVHTAVALKREAGRHEEAALIALLAQPGDVVRVSGGYMRLEPAPDNA